MAKVGFVMMWLIFIKKPGYGIWLYQFLIIVFSFYLYNCSSCFSLKGQEDDWKKHVKDNDCNELLLANCISASAFLTYCGPCNMDTRKRMGEFFMQVCEHHGLPLPKKSLFRNQQLVEFLYKPVSSTFVETFACPDLLSEYSLIWVF